MSDPVRLPAGAGLRVPKCDGCDRPLESEPGGPDETQVIFFCGYDGCKRGVFEKCAHCGECIYIVGVDEDGALFECFSCGGTFFGGEVPP